jgi:putative tryptophan/tyrosine transport system substrate-binding protein
MNRCLKLIILIIMTLVVMSLSNASASENKKIGILIFSDAPRYSEAVNGIRDVLFKAGYRKPHTEIIMENAMGNKARMAELVRQFTAAKLDLIIALGTSAAVQSAREIKDVPLVFSVVYDPVEAGIAKSWRSSGNNTTGASNKIPMARVMERLVQFTSVKRLAVLYTTGEKNSESELRDLQEVQTLFGIDILPAPMASREDLELILPEVLRNSDALYLTGCPMVTDNLPRIIELTNRAKVVTITHLKDLVEKGALLGVCADFEVVGRMSGEKAVKILRGAKPSSIPIEKAKSFSLIINSGTARKGDFLIPPDIFKSAQRIIN